MWSTHVYTKPFSTNLQSKSRVSNYLYIEITFRFVTCIQLIWTSIFEKHPDFVFSNLKNTRNDINLRFTDRIYTSCHFVGFFGTLLSKFFHNILVENNKNTEAAFCNASSHLVSPPSFLLDVVSAVSITTHLHVLSVIYH